MNTKTEANSEILENYTLGLLSESETEEIQDQLCCDEELFGRLEAVEMVLIDSYVRDKMPASKRELFEDNFLVTEENRRRVEGSRIFHKELAEISSNLSARSTGEKWFAPLVAVFRNPVTVSAAAGLALVFIIYGGYVLLIDRWEIPEIGAVPDNGSGSNTRIVSVNGPPSPGNDFSPPDKPRHPLSGNSGPEKSPPRPERFVAIKPDGVIQETELTYGKAAGSTNTDPTRDYKEYTIGPGNDYWEPYFQSPRSDARYYKIKISNVKSGKAIFNKAVPVDKGGAVRFWIKTNHLKNEEVYRFSATADPSIPKKYRVFNHPEFIKIIKP